MGVPYKENAEMLTPMEIPSLANIGSSFSQWGPTVIGGAIGATVLAKFGGIAPRIDQNHVGLLEWGHRATRVHDSTFGKKKAGDLYSKDVLLPGTHWVVPYFSSIRTVSTQDRYTDLEPLRAANSQLWLGDVQSTLQWHVARLADLEEWEFDPKKYNEVIYKAMYAPDEESGGLVGAVRKVASSALREVLQTVDDYEKIKQDEVFEQLHDDHSDGLFESYGVIMDALRIQRVAQTDGSIMAVSMFKTWNQLPRANDTGLDEERLRLAGQMAIITQNL